MKQPVATINDPLAPRATGGRPQPPSRDTKKVKVKAHTRRVKVRAPKPAPAAPVGDPLAAQVNAAADVKYGPQIRGLNQQVLGSQYNQIRAGNWYSDYEKQLQSQATAQNQAAANVAAALAKTFGNPSAAQTGNPQADALAAQAAQSQSHLGQSFAGTQSQMALDTANRFATGLIPAAGLAGRATQQNEVNRQQQLQGQLADVRGQAGEYKTLLRQQIQAAQQKALADQEKINLARRALGLKVNTYKNVQVPLAKSLAGNRRSNVRLKGQSQSETKHQHRVDNALKVNKLVLDAQKERDRVLEKGKGKKGKSDFTPTQVRGAHKDFRKALTLLSPATVKADPSGALKALTAPKNAKNPAGGQDPLVAHAIVQTLAYGGVDRKTADAYFRAYGIHLHVRTTYGDVLNTGIKILKNATGKKK